jgi:signal transduction histidine kinase
MRRRVIDALSDGAQAALDALLALAASGVRAPQALLCLPLPEGKWTCKASFGVEGERPADLESQVLSHVLATGQLVVVEEADAMAGGTLPLGCSCLLAAPVCLADETPVACLLVLDRVLRPFTAAQVAALEQVTTAASALVQERVKLQESREAVQGMRHQLERADRLAMVGKLAAGIAHELGTPLAVVAGRARQLASGQVPPEQLSSAAKTIADHADRMAAIIRQLLDYARRRGPRLGRFDLRTLLRQTVTLLEPVASRAEVSLVLDEAAGARVALFDGGQLLQVMTNLVANAVQATPAGGRVTLRLAEAELTPPAETGLPAGRYVQVRVTDTGIGIAAEHLGKVFEPFFTTKDTGEGTGLGLSVAQGIVRDHEGWIAVESQRGQGSTFIIHLPG